MMGKIIKEIKEFLFDKGACLKAPHFDVCYDICFFG